MTQNTGKGPSIHGDLNERKGLLASGVRTATQSIDLENYRWRGIIVEMDVTAVPTVETLTLEIRSRDVISGIFTVLLASTLNATVHHERLVLYPGIVAAANVSESDILPRDFNIRVVHSAAGNFTYSLQAQWIL